MTTATALPVCTKCRSPLAVELLHTPDFAVCPSCGAEARVEIFPALFAAPKRGSAGEAIMLDGESSCFYHPQKRAAVPCDACGRFLCALCDVDLGGEHLCPSCLEAGRKKGKITTLENSRMLYDDAALSMAVLPVVAIFTIPFTFITAPLAIFFAIRAFRTPGSILPRTRVRAWLALVIAGLTLAGWCVFLYTAITNDG
jgi:hypothetical protein